MPVYGDLVTSRPRYCSSALNTASFLNVPPWTTILSPRESMLETRMTLVNTFSIIDRHRPAMISSGFLPVRWAVTMLLFINTVQRLPRAAGFLEAKAAFSISCTGICSEAAKFSRKEPQPEEQASFTTILVMTPLSIHMAFMSWPPMSKRKVASGTYLTAALVWATVSTV